MPRQCQQDVVHGRQRGQNDQTTNGTLQRLPHHNSICSQYLCSCSNATNDDTNEYDVCSAIRDITKDYSMHSVNTKVYNAVVWNVTMLLICIRQTQIRMGKSKFDGNIVDGSSGGDDSDQ